MVCSIQPEWIAGPIPAPRHRERINGIYAGYVTEKQQEKKSWHEVFPKPWEIGRHKKDFCGQVRGSRTDDHKYIHYLPGKEARDHHIKCVDDTETWRARMLVDEYFRVMLAKNFACEKKRHYLNTTKRHKEEQQALWSKAEKKLTKFAYISDEDVPEDASRARDLVPEFYPLKHFEGDIRSVHLETSKSARVFYPPYVNLPALGRYLSNLDYVKRALLAELMNMPGNVPNTPTGKMGNFSTELELNAPSAESKVAALDLLEISKFESNVRNSAKNLFGFHSI